MHILSTKATGSPEELPTTFKHTRLFIRPPHLRLTRRTALIDLEVRTVYDGVSTGIPPPIETASTPPGMCLFARTWIILLSL